jgi:hypothetical protein
MLCKILGFQAICCAGFEVLTAVVMKSANRALGSVVNLFFYPEDEGDMFFRNIV